MPKNSGRALNREYKEKLVQKVMARAFTKSFLPGRLYGSPLHLVSAEGNPLSAQGEAGGGGAGRHGHCRVCSEKGF